MFGLIAAIMPLVGDLIDKVIPDKNAAQKAKLEMEGKLVDMMQQLNLGQLGLNTQEASHRSIFVAGWRPFIGWSIGTALAYQYVLSPISVWFSTIIGHPIPPPPPLDEMLWELMFAMLGMAGLRTWEKSRGLTK